jgi:hypothetical protein
LDLLPGLTALGESFPFPQIHEGQVHTVIFGSTKIWEYVGGQTPCTLVLDGLTPGDIWEVADFFDYIVATNGQQIVKRDPVTHEWSVVNDTMLPISECVAAVNGQLLVGSPQKEF